MTRPPIMICDLKVSDNVWKIVTHVVYLWIVKERNGQHNVEYVIKDFSVSELDLTLWETYAYQFMADTTENTTTCPKIIIITHAKFQQSSTTRKLYISNAWNGSKLFIDYDHPQVISFKAKLGDIGSSNVLS
ncbi:hypothetical protein KIW84_023383 [Lathyrus oleraceus]|uniref:Uncharacterized protein n=1 Tax=Pisum sativum TaxID=3888 RepID=A0A9D4YEU6_PEA|nr:hypothetical protein KIW84_023383 [Pisum sativum]